MTSNDNVSMNELKLLLENHFNRTEKQLADFQKDNAEFKSLMIKEFSDFKETMRKEFSDFKDEMRVELQGVRSEIANVRSELKAEIADVRAEIADVRSEVRIQSTRIDKLVHWNYWFIALFAAFFLMPSVIDGVRSTFKALSNSISALFKRK